MAKTGSELAPFEEEQAQAPMTQGSMIEVAQSGAAARVQAAMVIAQKFPRDPVASESRILVDCRRMKLAEQAFYSYSKGGSSIFGASVHLSRAMAANWGNCECGWVVLASSPEESIVECFCWDYQTNHKQSITFTVRHEMKAHQKIKKLTDPREVYEHVANMAARRVRAVTLGVLPGWLQDAAVEQCQKTLAGGSKTPLIDRVKALVRWFADNHSITQEMIEAWLQHKLEVTDEAQFIRLRGIAQSLRDGASKREDWFQIAPAPSDDGPSDADDLSPGRKETSRGTETPAEQPAAEMPETPEGGQTAEAPPPDASEELFGSPAAAPAKAEEPATTNRLKIEQLAKLCLDNIGHEGTPAEVQKLIGFAAIGTGIVDPKKPSMVEAQQIAKAIKTMTDADVNEALTAD